MNTSPAESQHSVNLIDPQKIDVPTLTINGRRLRLLVAIASYGRKNDSFLRQIIQKYQSMAMEVDVIVLSEAPKDLGSEVKVIVGLPSPNPWSLPFAHKPVLAGNVDNYDLFIYSEDDMGVTEKNLQAFLNATTQLEPDEIAGYLRYEVGQNGILSLPDVHEAYHWKPESVKKRGSLTVAEFTNEHAAFYILTQAQLRKAIKSGGFLREPCEGRYDFACTAATDPYTNCGFRKVICISVLEDFLLHHLSNRYTVQLGVPLSAIKEQIQTLMDICKGAHPATTLCRVESELLHGKWSKSYGEKPRDEVLDMIPQGIRTVLSVGCGSGDVEAKLMQQGMTITALPLDSVVGVVAARLGIEMIYGDWEEAVRQLAGRKFDCVLVTNLLHLQPDPVQFLAGCAGCVGEGGTLLAAGPNFNRLPNWFQRNFGANGYRKLKSFAKSGINLCGPGTFLPRIKNLGLNSTTVRWLDQELSERKWSKVKAPLGGLTARNWILRARRSSV